MGCASNAVLLKGPHKPLIGEGGGGGRAAPVTWVNSKNRDNHLMIKRGEQANKLNDWPRGQHGKM